jgi:hypothetical protein
MDEIQAEAVAKALGGDIWNSGGEMYLVILRRSDGRVVAISDESVCVYASEDALQSAQPLESTILR